MERVMTLDELAQFLRVHRSTVYRLLKNKDLPGFRIGSDWRFNVESIEHWLEAAQINPRWDKREGRAAERGSGGATLDT